MRCLIFLAMLFIDVPVRCVASPHILWSPPAESLGLLARDCPAIHSLSVVAVTPKSVSFKVVKAMKGKPADMPFLELEILHDSGKKGLFRAGDAVVCFLDRPPVQPGMDRAVRLHVGGRWTSAVSPSEFRGEKHWLCWQEVDYSATSCGTTEKLCEAVEAVLTGREIIILARNAEMRRGENELGRLWRIRAGMKVASLVPHDESPHFVGWGTGEPDEVAGLERELRDPSEEKRVTSAADLAYLGAAARPALRRALDDPVAAVSMAAVKALTRIDPDGREAEDFLRSRLRDASAEFRNAAAATPPRTSRARRSVHDWYVSTSRPKWPMRTWPTWSAR